MKRSMLAILPALILNPAVIPVAIAAESTETTRSIEQHAMTVFDVRDEVATGTQEKNGGKPPSGDSNPSDLTNSTVDARDIINPQRKSTEKPPSGDRNPSDLSNSTVDTRDIINPQR